MNRFFLCIFLFLVAMPVMGNKASTEISSKSKNLTEIQKELRQKRLESERLKKEADEISKAVKSGKIKLRDVEDALLHTRKKNLEVERYLANSKNRKDVIDQSLSRANQKFKNSIQLVSASLLLAPPHSSSRVLSQQLMRSSVINVEGLKKEKQEEWENYQELANTYDLIQGEVNTQESRLGQIRTGVVKKERLLEKKLTRREMLDEELKALERTAEELASLIDVLRTKAKEELESERKARTQKWAAGKSPIARASLPWPTQGKITRVFGRQKHPELQTLYISNGIVVEPNSENEVRAVSDGRVLYNGPFMSYGLMTVVEHDGDWFSVYGLLASGNVEKGQIVKRGDAIGEAGLSPNGRPEVYFELRFYGKPVDPLPWLAN